MQPMRSAFSRAVVAALATIALSTSIAGHAQTCAAPVTMSPGSILAADTCGAQNFGGGGVPNWGAVFDLSLDQPSVVAFTVSSQSFTPSVCITAAGDCGTSTCTAQGDAITPTGTLPPGAYWVIVAPTPLDFGGVCGTFEIGNETHAADTVLANGFD